MKESGNGGRGLPPSHGSQGDVQVRGHNDNQVDQRRNQIWEENPQSRQRKSQISLPSSSHSSVTSFGSENELLDLTYEEGIDDDAEIYLRPGEPYGAVLLPVADPYIPSEKIVEANRELFSGYHRRRKTKTKVHFRDELNEYYDFLENDDSPPLDYEVASEILNVDRRQTTDRTRPSPPSQGDSAKRHYQSDKIP